MSYIERDLEEPEPDAEAFGLLSTSEFIVELHERLAAAERVIEIELMTFDGDAAGLAVADALLAAVGRGVEVRLLVDCFAKRFVSDQPVGRPAVRAEFAETLGMFDRLEQAGVKLRFTHPNGPLHIFSLARNHKKLYLIDDVVYLGGINVSDHNFEWHDFMIRVDEPSVRRAVAADFNSTFNGQRVSVDEVIVTNTAVETTFDRLVAKARDRVVIASPYALDRRLVAAMDRCTAPERSIVMAGHNNFRFLETITPYLAERAEAVGVNLYTYERFSHSKFVLVDDDQLLVGSSNFGRHSFWCNQEIGLVIRDRGFIEEFEKEYLSGLVPFEQTVTTGRRALGRFLSFGMDHYLAAYARVVASRVAPLADNG